MKQSLVAIRSSATAEDLPTASFAGQQETFLNVKGEANVVEKVKACWASLFEARAIFYREEKKFDHLKVGMAVPVQEMVPAEVSGVMFTINPINNDKKVLLIEAIYGLGEYIVQGKVTPDSYLVNKKPLEIISSNLAKQTVQLIKVKSQNKEKPVPRRLQTKKKLTPAQVKTLAKLGIKIHRHYFFPQDIEWVLAKNKLYIVQTRPVTTIETRAEAKLKKKLSGEGVKREIILSGVAASPGMVSGSVQKIESAREINQIKTGDILVTSMTTPDFVPAMKKAVAIITDKGGQTSHAAIVSRELGIPCLVGTEKATKILKNGQMVTVNGNKGEVYQGGLKTVPQDWKGGLKNKPSSSLNDYSLHHLKTATKIYVNLGEPSLAETIAQKKY